MTKENAIILLDKSGKYEKKSHSVSVESDVFIIAAIWHRGRAMEGQPRPYADLARFAKRLDKNLDGYPTLSEG